MADLKVAGMAGWMDVKLGERLEMQKGHELVLQWEPWMVCEMGTAKVQQMEPQLDYKKEMLKEHKMVDGWESRLG